MLMINQLVAFHAIHLSFSRKDHGDLEIFPPPSPSPLCHSQSIAYKRTRGGEEIAPDMAISSSPVGALFCLL